MNPGPHEYQLGLLPLRHYGNSLNFCFKPWVWKCYKQPQEMHPVALWRRLLASAEKPGQPETEWQGGSWGAGVFLLSFSLPFVGASHLILMKTTGCGTSCYGPLGLASGASVQSGEAWREDLEGQLEANLHTHNCRKRTES